MNTNHFLRPFLGRAALILIPLVADPAWARQEEKTYDLTWDLPHEKAAVYGHLDLKNRKPKPSTWVLGCEVSRPLGATDTTDLPMRYLFRMPHGKQLKVGEIWEVEETAFADLPTEVGLAPVFIKGGYHLKEITTSRVKDLLPISMKEHKGARWPTHVAVVEGRVWIYRGNWVERRNGIELSQAEKRPSGFISTLTYVRVRDGAILGGRYERKGRSDRYSGLYSEPKVSNTTALGEVVLREPYVDVTKDGLRTRIDKAIKQGVAWLRAQERRDGHLADPRGYMGGSAQGLGGTSMSVLAMTHSGVPKDDPLLRNAWGYLRSKRINNAYDVALFLMALQGRYLTLGKIKDIENFSEEDALKDIAVRITPEDKKAAATATRTLLGAQRRDGTFGYDAGGYLPNLSSLQYALLGLKAASRLGAKIPPSVWKKALDGIESYSERTAEAIDVKLRLWTGEVVKRPALIVNFYYDSGCRPFPQGTMACAAIAGVAICRSELIRAGEWNAADEKRAAAISWGALAWMQKYYSVRSSQPEGQAFVGAHYFYYLYGLERAAIFSGIREINGHDWYLEGAAQLLAMQQPDGRWKGRFGIEVVDTAFALLFLKRATIPVGTSDRPRIASADDRPKHEE